MKKDTEGSFLMWTAEMAQRKGKTLIGIFIFQTSLRRSFQRKQRIWHIFVSICLESRGIGEREIVLLE